MTDQFEILNHIREYYVNLFDEKGSMDVNLIKLLKKSMDIKICDSNLGNPITVKEIGQVLKRMKNNKSPGIDGFTSELFKVFYSKLQYFITNSINSCFKKGILSPTHRKSILGCLPKGNKNRKYIKKWRPISLPVTYKLASGVIACRLKVSLKEIISKTQTGFLSGKQISDSKRLVYGIMQYTENKNIPGLMMLIDFEKAFDCVSWKFLYKALEFNGFSETFIQWIKLFNNDIGTYVLQSGLLSKRIPIRRGCRQGDPISAYLFLIAADVMAVMIKFKGYQRYYNRKP